MTRGFSRDLCDFCGDCFSLCPVLRLSPEHSREASKALADCVHLGDVLDRCTGCMSCDAICKRRAQPYGLLLDHYRRMYLREGIPGVFRGAMPQRKGPTIWGQLERWPTKRKRDNLRRWSRPAEKGGRSFSSAATSDLPLT